MEKKLIRGRLIESVVAAIVYMVCRLQGVPRTLDEIAEVSHSNKKEIGKTYRFLVRELGVDVPLTTPLDYVSRFASALGLSGEAQDAQVLAARQPDGPRGALLNALWAHRKADKRGGGAGAKMGAAPWPRCTGARALFGFAKPGQA